MPVIRFNPDINSGIVDIAAVVDAIALYARMLRVTPAQVDMTLGSMDFTMRGSGFQTADDGYGPYLSQGQIRDIIVDLDGDFGMSITDIALPVRQLLNAYTLEVMGADPAAVENLLLTKDYTYYGNANADLLPMGVVTGDGLPFNLRGDDVMYLRGGNDHVFAGDGNDKLYGGPGYDRLLGGRGNDLLEGQAGNDTLIGNAGNDTLRGGAGRDLLQGGAGADRLEGGAGSDRLEGGAGADMLIGGAGADVFVFTTGSSTGGQRDTITDFGKGNDRIDLSALFTEDASFIGADRFSGHGPEVRYAGSVLFIDSDGDGRSDHSILIRNGFALGDMDLLL